MIALWLACSSPQPRQAPPPVDAHAAVQDAKVDTQQPIALSVEVYTAPGWQVQLQPPHAEGLIVTPAGSEGPQLSGTRERLVKRYRLSGPDGSYIIQPGRGEATSPDGAAQPIEMAPIFVDIGVEGPSGGEMKDFAALPPQPHTPWGWIIGGVVVGVSVISVGAWLWSRRPQPPHPIESPRDRARRRWTHTRQASLSDPQQAIALSTIFRDYLEERYRFPASAQTSREVLRALKETVDFSPALQQNLTELLEASDRLKFAREGGGEAFFARLDDSFEAVLNHTTTPPPGGDDV